MRKGMEVIRKDSRRRWYGGYSCGPGRGGSANGAGVRRGGGWREEERSEAAEVEVQGGQRACIYPQRQGKK